MPLITGRWDTRLPSACEVNHAFPPPSVVEEDVVVVVVVAVDVVVAVVVAVVVVSLDVVLEDSDTLELGVVDISLAGCDEDDEGNGEIGLGGVSAADVRRTDPRGSFDPPESVVSAAGADGSCGNSPRSVGASVVRPRGPAGADGTWGATVTAAVGIDVVADSRTGGMDRRSRVPRAREDGGGGGVATSGSMSGGGKVETTAINATSPTTARMGRTGCLVLRSSTGRCCIGWG